MLEEHFDSSESAAVIDDAIDKLPRIDRSLYSAGIKRKPAHHFFKRKKILGQLGFTAALSILLFTSAQPAEFEKGDFSLDFDTTLSYGLTWRLDDREPELIGSVNGGSAFSVNGDDGNLNYDTGVVSNRLRITTESELSYRNFGPSSARRHSTILRMRIMSEHELRSASSRWTGLAVAPFF